MDALAEANQTLDVVYEMSQLLNTGLDRQTVQLLMALCEHGVNPEALAAVVRELRREAASISASGAASGTAAAAKDRGGGAASGGGAAGAR